MIFRARFFSWNRYTAVLVTSLSVLILSSCATTPMSPWQRSVEERAATTSPNILTSNRPARTNESAAIRTYEDYLRSLLEDDAQTRERAAQAARQGGATERPMMRIQGEDEPVTSGLRNDGTATSVDDLAFEPTRNQRAQADNSSYAVSQSQDRRPPLLSSGTQGTKVALLLPLTGDNAQIGNAMLNAAQLALFDIGRGQFTLLPKDTQSTRQGAQAAAREAIGEGAQLILGPLFADGVRAIRPLVERHNILNIAFSTDWTVAGGNSYIMGILPFAQVQRVTQYVAAQGTLDYGLIAPRSPYGNVAAASFSQAVRQNGGLLTKSLLYSPLEDNINLELREFLDYDTRKATYDALIEVLTPIFDPEEEEILEENAEQAVALSQEEQTALELAEQEAALESLGELADALPQDPLEQKALWDSLQTRRTFGPLPFQTLMVPVGGENARTIINLIRYYDVEPQEVQLIGTGLWDDVGLAREAAFDGALFAAPSPDARRGFEGRYQDVYGNRPPRIASLAYDATALAAVLAQTASPGTQAFTRAALLNPNGFSGIDGIFRFRQDGLIERGLAILEVKRGRITVKDPAPSTFQAPQSGLYQ